MCEVCRSAWLVVGVLLLAYLISAIVGVVLSLLHSKEEKDGREKVDRGL